MTSRRWWPPATAKPGCATASGSRHCRAACRLIAISRYVADQLVAFGVEADRIEVIPNGISPASASANPASEDRWRNRLDVNKNLPALFRGVDQLQRRQPQWRALRIVGRGGRSRPGATPASPVASAGAGAVD